MEPSGIGHATAAELRSAASAAATAQTDHGSQDDESRALLQSRLTLVLAVLAGISLFISLSSLLTMAVTGKPPTAPMSVVLATLSLGLVVGAGAIRYRSGRRSPTELRLADALTTAGTCWACAGTLSQIKPETEASVSLALGVTYILFARTVLLPSSTWRTIWVSTLAVVPAGAVASWLRVKGLGRETETADWLVQSYVAYRALVISAFLATLTSSVIYGLRRRVSEIARIGQYVLRDKLGEGGMGVVYRATHALLRRDTAIKLLLPSRAGAQSVARFEREVTLTAQLTHANTVAIFDYGRTPDGVFYYAMEYLEGGDLEQLIAYTGPLPPARAIWVLDQVCRALAEAHGLGLVHRDIKPSNVLLCERGREGDVAKILDFGLVKDLNAAEGGVATGNEEAIAGTPLYLSPESITAPSAVDARSDLYSLGALAYYLVTGTPPFSGKIIVEICAAHLYTVPEPPSERRAGLPADLDAVILRCLAKEPSARYADAEALLAALRACAAAGQWRPEQAASWWAEHREAFRTHCDARRKALSAATAVTDAATEHGSAIRIDLERRLHNSQR
jgi:eukaryotic-like serine/threonine-protein kinase